MHSTAEGESVTRLWSGAPPALASYTRRMTLEVSVVIPTRDRWPVLSTSALPSALGQQSVEHEVIVVDDGSIDETQMELAKVEATRLKVIRHGSPSGVAQARNAGIAAAAGEWIAFLDDDDLWAPHKLRRQLDVAKAAGASFAYCGAAWLDEDKCFIEALSPPAPDGLDLRLLRWNELWAGCSSVVARADVVRRLGGFDERLFQLADWDLWIRLAFDGPAAAVDEILVGYVRHRRSMLLTDRRDVFAEFDCLVDKHRALSTRTGVAPDVGKFWRWVAAGHLRAGRRGTAAWTFARGAYESRDPPALARAPAALLGERAFVAARALARRARRTPPAAEANEPAWIAGYRHRPAGRTG
jgi:glycosyltransferase involved in cell wall biosynthesis